MQMARALNRPSGRPAKSAHVKFSLTQDFPTDPARLWSVLGRGDYVERKYRSLGAMAIRMLKFDITPDTIEVKLERSVPIARKKLPVWARPFLGDQQMMRHRTRWRRIGPTQIDAELDIAPVGVPVHAHGLGTVVEDLPGQTRMTLRFDVTCTVPALGDRVARLFAEQVKEALQADHAFTLGHLAASSDAAQASDRTDACA